MGAGARWCCRGCWMGAGTRWDKGQMGQGVEPDGEQVGPHGGGGQNGTGSWPGKSKAQIKGVEMGTSSGTASPYLILIPLSGTLSPN